MAQIGRFLGYAGKSEPFTNIVRLTGGMRIQEGVASTDDLKLDFEGGSLAAAGTIGLADQSLKLRMTTVIGKQYADRFGGNKVGGYLTTVLANPKGELIIPCLVEGNASKPRFTSDAEALARMKLQNLLPSTANPAGGILRVVEALSGKRGQPEAKAPAAESPAAEEAKPEQPKRPTPGAILRDLLKSRKKKEPTQPE